MKRFPARPVVLGQRAYRHTQAVNTIHAIYAASLRPSGPFVREAAYPKQEPPSLAGNEGSTDPRQVMADGMAASAQSDTNTR